MAGTSCIITPILRRRTSQSPATPPPPRLGRITDQVVDLRQAQMAGVDKRGPTTDAARETFHGNS
jgi:hypothetical protein